MFGTRLISGIVLVIIALVTIISGGPVLFFTLLVISLIGMHELYRAVGVEKDGKISLLSAVGYLGAVLYDCLMYFEFHTSSVRAVSSGVSEPAVLSYTMIGLVGVLIALLAVYVFTYPRYRSEQVMAAFFGVEEVSA